MTKKIFSLTASIIKVFIILSIFLSNSKADENNIKYYSGEVGTLSIMYHRFNENKYPSTNIQMDVFKKQIEMIKEKKYQFEDPNLFDENFNNVKKEKKILITIDDAFTSFYEHAWPYLKQNKIPFILFVSTEAIGKNGYMNWEQLKEVEKESFGYLGNHSHTHEYLVDFSFDDFKKDINTSIKIFKKEIGYNPIFFSYPFGEYTDQQLKFISGKFKYAFGQHSGVIDQTKNKFELPRFPINEKYGEIKRFKSLLKNIPFPYKKILPEEKYLADKNNPPDVTIYFFENQKNLENIGCYSNEQNKWRKSKLLFTKKNIFLS